MSMQMLKARIVQLEAKAGPVCKLPAIGIIQRSRGQTMRQLAEFLHYTCRGKHRGSERWTAGFVLLIMTFAHKSYQKNNGAVVNIVILIVQSSIYEATNPVVVI